MKLASHLLKTAGWSEKIKKNVEKIRGKVAAIDDKLKSTLGEENTPAEKIVSEFLWMSC